MRAVRFDRFGPPEELHVVDVDIPVPRADEVLVRVLAAGVGGGEAQIRSGQMRRLSPVRPPAGTGSEYVGDVVEVGPQVRNVHPGDRVWGVMPHLTFGSMADFVAVPEKRVGTPPTGLEPVSAAALPMSGTTALASLTKARLTPGARILVRGGSGGVGSLAIQLAHARGAEVVALASKANRDWVAALGADTVVDYRAVDPARLGEFDIVLDAVGTDLRRYRRLLRRDGRFVALAFDTSHVLTSLCFVAGGTFSRRRRVVAFSNNAGTGELDALTERVEAGDVRPVVDEVFALDQLPAAHRRLEGGGVRGKLIVDLTLHR